jgi:nitrogenase molybdenum-iron protein NifN
MLDGHFHFGAKRFAIALEPDLMASVAALVTALGGEVVAAVTTTASPLNATLACDSVLIGDLSDFEEAAGAAGADLLVSHSHARQASERLGVPLLRLGLPLFDRLGGGHRVAVGYRGARDLIFEIANVFLARIADPAPDTWPLLAPKPDIAQESAPASAVPARLVFNTSDLVH